MANPKRLKGVNPESSKRSLTSTSLEVSHGTAAHIVSEAPSDENKSEHVFGATLYIKFRKAEQFEIIYQICHKHAFSSAFVERLAHFMKHGIGSVFTI